MKKIYLLMEKIELDSLIRYLLILLVLSLPISGALSTFFWLLIFLLSSFLFIKNPDFKIFKDKVHYPLYLFVFVSILSIFFALDFSKSILEFKKIGQIFIMFIFLFNVKDLTLNKRLLKFLFFSVAAVSIFGLIQYMVGLNRIYGGGYEVPYYLQNLPRYFYRFLTLNSSRIQGSQSFYLTYASIIGMIFSLVLPQFIYGLIFKKREFNHSAVYKIYFLCVLTAIVFTYARAVWLGIFTVVLTLFTIEIKFRKIMFKAGSVLILGLILVSFFKINNRSIINRIKEMNIKSNMDRISMWQGGLRIIKDYPVLGVGPKSVHKVYKEYVPKAGRKYAKGHLHSNYIHIAATRGILALFLYCAMFFSYFYIFFINYIKSKDEYIKYLSLGGVCMIVFFSVSGLTEYSFGDNEVAMVLWALIGIVLSAIRTSAPKSSYIKEE